jgi:Zn-finger nucleic acid-binding protein
MALLETRPCWQCGHCGTLIAPESAALDGVRVLGGPQDGRARACPVCAQPMLAAVMDDRYRIEMCAQCKGTLMPRETFAETVVGRRREATTAATSPPPANRRELQRRVACPSCEGRMLTDWYYGPGNIVIDSCPACDLVWLDAGELQRVVDAPGGDRRP